MAALTVEFPQTVWMVEFGGDEVVVAPVTMAPAAPGGAFDGDASDVPYTPATEGDWGAVPAQVAEALDELAGRESGGGAVDSVNGATGTVVLDAGDVGADPAGTAAGLVDDLSGVTDAATARSNLGLGNVDNTSDANKPVSTAQQTALDAKLAASLVDAKGDLIVGTADNTVARVAVGSNGQVLTADSTQTAGVKWAAPSAAIAHFYEDDIYSGLQGLAHATIGGGGTGVLYGAHLLYLWRIMSPQDVTIDGLLMQVQVGGGSGALACCGIYAQGATTAPVGAPLVQSADLNVNVATGTQVSAALTPTALTAWTPYWGALVVNSGTTQIRYMANGANNTTRVSSLDAGQSSLAFHTLRRVAHTFGALPTNPATSFTSAVGDIPGVLWKVQV